MSEVKSDLLDDYMQIGKGDVTDSFQPGDNKQRIDLSEYYEDTKQGDSKVMVMGTEAFNLGKISRDLVIKLGLPNPSQYDPFASERNARMGTEGFLTKISEGFKSFIENIIKYIQMAINWVVDTFKTWLGYKPTVRVTKEINNKLEDLQTEFLGILKGLGFPENTFNLEEWLGRLPPDKVGKTQLHLLMNKVNEEEQTIQNLFEVVPLIQKANRVLVKIGNDMVRESKKFSRVLEDETRNARALLSTTSDIPVAKDSIQVNRVNAALNELRLVTLPQELNGVISAIFEKLYGIRFSNNAMEDGFVKLREELKQNVISQNILLRNNEHTRKQITGVLMKANSRYVELKEDTPEIGRVDWKTIGRIVNVPDSQKIQFLQDTFRATTLVSTYSAVAIEVRDVTNGAYLIGQELLKLEKQIESITSWHARTSVYFMAGVLGDIETMKRVNQMSMAEGRSPVSAKDGTPHMGAFFSAIPAEGFKEQFAQHANLLLEMDLVPFKKALNNFSKQMGLGGL